MEKSVIVFDGECNLCNGVVGWLLKFAPVDIFQFVPFQSPQGQDLLKQYDFPTSHLETVILFDENGKHTHSDGFLKIISKIPKWRLPAALLAFVPRIVRDTIYKIASRNRVKWFGKSQTCTVSF
ncbi:DUF393 domain-containing protein [Flagellimonas hymeniacidonis]|uniref:DUF393 domain-containing protein n=1 Tax=Flagellimonas hymeniacidonis TaxID=2603628 RepID=A0A5C8V0R9_9FLAO|nr:DUF393 domain-containing protein [Flagellimonas hymeniacidonis]TXN34722.1 DUF393 domain-containing protein [Flagellimonas hymeniacidonis]